MGVERLRVLLIEDDRDDYIIVRTLLARIAEREYELDWEATYQAGLKALCSNRHDVCLADYYLGSGSGLDLLREAAARNCRVPIILLTGRGDRQVDVLAMKAGAADYLAKEDLRAPLLERAIRYAAERVQTLKDLRDRGAKLERLNASLEEANQKLKEAQTHLVQSEKMASLGQLVAGIAHEINNPLTFVLNNVFTLGRRLEEVAGEAKPHLSQAASRKLERSQTLVKDILEGTERVKDLVVKLRTFSRLDEGEFKTVDIHESIDSVLLFLKHRIKDHIQVEKDYGDVPNLSCYPGQLNQVLMNIISNSVDAIEGEGKITIATRQEKDVFRILVKDTGKGIPEEILDRIYEPFFTTKLVGEGTGLGLAISYSIIQAHRGRLNVRSREGEGTEFTIEIPLNLRQAEE